MITIETMKPLLSQRTKLRWELKKVDTAINALQEICEHEWISDGHDSHKDHYICSICKKTESR